jgi:hypothetical protein
MQVRAFCEEIIMVDLETLWLLFLTLPDGVKGLVLVAFVIVVMLILRATPLWKNEPWSHL